MTPGEGEAAESLPFIWFVLVRATSQDPLRCRLLGGRLMADACNEMLADHGVPEKDIAFDKF